MVVGGTQRASAQVFSTAGARMTTGFNLTYRSSDPGVASIDGQGAIRGTGVGNAWLVAVAGSARDSARVTVAALVAAVEIAGSDVTLEVGASQALTASTTDANGARLQRDIAWSSSNPAVATVDPGTGRVTARAEGTAQVTAASDGFSDAVAVRVAAPAPALPSAGVVATAIQGYVASLSGGDRDTVRRLWGTADQDGLGDVIDVMGESRFSAALGTVGDPSQEGGAATVPFVVNATYRSFAGGERRPTLNFVGRFERSGSNWVLQSVRRPVD
jgi:uncharacterized protein YjdB